MGKLFAFLLNHLLSALLCATALSLNAQQNQNVGINVNNPNPNAVLELVSPGNNQGLLVPRLSRAQRTAPAFISSLSLNDKGLLVFDSTDNLFYFWDGLIWVAIPNQAGGVALSAGQGISIVDNMIINTGDNDNDPTNEIQDLILEGSILRITNNPGATEIDLSGLVVEGSDEQTLALDGTALSISNGNTVDLAGINTDAQTLQFSGSSISISNGNTIDIGIINTDNQNLGHTAEGTNRTITISGGSGTTISVADNDNDPTNEIQDLQLTGSTLRITNNPTATAIDLSPYMGENTDEQTLSLSGTQLSISNGNTVNLAPINTDNQTLSLAGNLLSIAGGNNVNLSSINTDNQSITVSASGVNRTINISGGTGDTFNVADNDNDPANELITAVSLTGTILRITDAGGNNDVNLAGINTDNQTLNLTGTNLAISGGNSVNIASINTDNQNLTHTVDGTSRTINISGGTGTTISVADNDNDPANELITAVSLTGTTLRITDAGGNNDVNLASINTDNQTLSIATDNLSISGGNNVSLAAYRQNLTHTSAGTNRTINISGGTGTTISVADNDNDPLNEIQDLELTGTTLRITNNASATPIDLSPFVGENTDEQTLSLSGTQLSISNGNTVDLTPINTDNQSLSLSGTTLAISGGNNVNLAPINTDNQTLNLSGTTLSISGGNNVNLSSVNTDNQNITVTAAGTNRTINISGGTGDTFSIADNDNSPTNELITSVSLTGTTLRITDAGGNNDVNLASINTDNQTLSLSGTTLSISGGNNVNLATVNTDNQTLSIAADNLSISGGNNVSLAAYRQNLSHTVSGTNRTINISGGTGTTINVADNDNDATNELLQAASLTGNTLRLVDAGGNTDVDLSPLASKWTTVEGTNIFYANRVAVGTNINPAHQLQVHRNSAVASIFPILEIKEDGNTGSASPLRFTNANNNHFNMGITGNGQFALSGPDVNIGLSSDLIRIQPGGNVGLGTVSPSSRLDVNGTATMSGFRLTTGATNGYVLTSNASGVGTWQAIPSGFSANNYIPRGDGSGMVNSIIFNNNNYIGVGRTTATVGTSYFDIELPTTGTAFGGMVLNSLSATGTSYLGFYHNGILSSRIQSNGNTGNLQVLHGGIIRMTITSDGNTGIGTTTPSSTLHVVGDTRQAGRVISPSTAPISITGTNQTISVSRKFIKVTAATTGRGIAGILNGEDGQEVIITNTGNNNINITQGSGANNYDIILVGGTGYTLAPYYTLHLIYDATRNVWLEVSRSNNFPWIP